MAENDLQKQQEYIAELEKEHHYLKSIINNIAEPIMVIKEDYSIELMNDIVKSQLHKLNIADPQNPKCYEVSHHRETPCDGVDHPCPLRDVMQSKTAEVVTHNHLDAEGNGHFVEITATPLMDKDDNCVGIIESAHNITNHLKMVQELEEKSRELDHKAHHDGLTSLPNRMLFVDRLEQAIESCVRDQKRLSLLFIDLDNFKIINDTLGHEAGDEVLKLVSTRIKSVLRATDTLSRLGGDEFTAIIKDVYSKEDVMSLSKKILETFTHPFRIACNDLFISCSIGISTYPESPASELIKHADAAMYRAKEKGKNNFQHY